jgi:hypothetical protein
MPKFKECDMILIYHFFSDLNAWTEHMSIVNANVVVRELGGRFRGISL